MRTLFACLIVAIAAVGISCSSDRAVSPQDPSTTNEPENVLRDAPDEGEVSDVTSESSSSEETSSPSGFFLTYRFILLHVSFAEPLSADEIDAFADSMPEIIAHSDPHHISPLGPVVPDSGVGRWSFGMVREYFESGLLYPNAPWLPSDSEVEEAMQLIRAAHPDMVVDITSQLVVFD